MKTVPDRYILCLAFVLALARVLCAVDSAACGADGRSLPDWMQARKETVQVLFDAEEDHQAFAAIGRTLSENADIHVVVLQESWQPPIDETLSYFKKMRSLLPVNTHIHILLTGRKQNVNYLSPVDPMEETVWRQAIQSLGDPHTEVRSIRMLS